jgi:DNA modification methylase
MKILVIGSKDWQSYNDLMRYMTILIQDATEARPDDKLLTFVHAGSMGAENMVTEYIGKTEKYMRQKGFKMKEEIIRKKKAFELNDLHLMENGADAAIVFSTKDRRTRTSIKLLEEFGIPAAIYEE